MPTARLTERFLQGLPSPTAVTDWWDMQLAGFAVRAHPSGRRAWIVRWRDGTGRKRFEGGGTWPTVKVEQAREWARRILSRAALGLVEDAPSALGATLATLWAEYEARASGYERLNRASIGRCHVLPVLASLPVSQLRSSDIDRIVRNLADKPRTGTAVKVHLHGALELARTLNLFPDDRINPASLVRGYPYQPRKRHLSPSEVAQVWGALMSCSSKRLFGLCQAELFQCLMLTGARSGELKAALWSELDYDHPALVLNRHKTAHKGVRRIEFGARAWAIVQALPRRNDYLFYGRDPGAGIKDLIKPWYYVLAQARIEHATIHDLRRTFASCALNDGMPMQDIGVLLGHRELSITGIYALPDVKRRQDLIARAESAVLEASKRDI